MYKATDSYDSSSSSKLIVMIMVCIIVIIIELIHMTSYNDDCYSHAI